MRRRELPGGIAPPTKTELKRQAHAVQDLADRLIAAPPELASRLGLPDKLQDAISLARRIKGGGALVRQRQFVAKQLRGLDLDPIRSALDAHADKARLEAARFRRAERWRDRLAAGDDGALDEFTAEFAADPAELSRLARRAADERRRGASGGAARELFRYVSGILKGQPGSG
jgi:ribosome-associated protein